MEETSEIISNPFGVLSHFASLIEANYSNDYPSVNTPNASEVLFAEKLYESYIAMLDDYVAVDIEEVFVQEPIHESATCETDSTSQSTQHESDSDYDYVSPSTRSDPVKISKRRKEEIVELWKQHPTWSLASLRKRGKAIEIPNKVTLYRWRKQVEQGKNREEKVNLIDKYVYEMLLETRNSLKILSSSHLRMWGFQKFIELGKGFRFTAGRSWLQKFRNKYNISSRKITHLVSKREIQNADNLEKSCTDFRKTIHELSNQFSPKNIFNTDQCGFHYELLPNRTLTFKGEKKVYAFSQSPNNLATHSYTVQYIINMQGEIFPKVLVCLQEKLGKLGPGVKRDVENYIPPNIFLTCSSSGKLSTSLTDYFLEQLVAPNVHENFLWIIDSWPGHTNVASYDKVFGKRNNRPEVCIKVIPEKCTPFLQPLDTTFHRQLKYLAKRITTSLEIFVNQHGVHQEDNWTNRKGIIKLQSLLHFQLCSPLFIPLVKYSWFSAGLTKEKNEFMNVKEVCFSFVNNVICEMPECCNIAFICCSHCRNLICLNHFWIENHINFCEKSPFGSM